MATVLPVRVLLLEGQERGGKKEVGGEDVHFTVFFTSLLFLAGCIVTSEGCETPGE